MLAPNVADEAEPLANFSGSKHSSYPLKYQYSKKPKGANHCPLEDHQTIIFEADLTGSCIKHEGNYCSQQQKKDEPAKQKHGLWQVLGSVEPQQ